MAEIIVSPPVAFALLLVFILAAILAAGRLAPRVERRPGDGKDQAYACGEEFDGHLIQPDYSQFFPFAFFFTILHVAALMLATIPTQLRPDLGGIALYLAVIATGLVVLLRRRG